MSASDAPEVSVVTLSEPPPPGVDPDGTLMPGQVIDDKYEIVCVLGTGGAATVYQARHTMIDRIVAIKVLDAGLKHNTAIVNRFINEGRAAGALGHDHIVKSTDMGYALNGCPFLVLEHLEGRDIEDEVDADGPIEPHRALRILAQAASAMVAAHAKGIIHRDLKPSNLFLVQRMGRADHVKVLDFGVSKFSTSGVTQAGSLFGTAEFMPPEQIAATDMVDARSDVYTLGLVLYFMLTGHVPFYNEDPEQIMRDILEREPPPMSKWRPGIPAEVEELVTRCMQKSPADRFQTMSELESALSDLLAPAVTPMTPPSSRRSHGRTLDDDITDPQRDSRAPAQSTGPFTLGTEPPRAHNRRWLALAALTVAVAAGAYLGGKSLQQASADPVPVPVTASEVKLAVLCDGGVMTFRGRDFLLPFEGSFRASAERERIELKPANGATRTIWLVLDQPRRVRIAQP